MPEPTPRTLVVAMRQDTRVGPTPVNDIRVGWRITRRDGDPYDLWWGAVRPDALDTFLENVRREVGIPFTVLDLRETPDAIRDSRYYSTPQ